MIQLSVFFSINFSFQVCIDAKLNIGVAQAIWAVNPFFVALLEWLCYGMRLHTHHYIGMFVMVLCVLAVSLSKLGEESEIPNANDDDVIEPTELIWKAVLASLLPPAIITLYAIYIKYV